MRTKWSFVLFFFTLFAFSQESEKKQVASVLDAWHQAAANADFDSYFGHMTADGVFLGTDATENWQNQEFREIFQSRILIRVGHGISPL